MTSKERVHAVIAGEIPDRVPLFETAFNPHFAAELAVNDFYEIYDRLGLDLFAVWPNVPGPAFDRPDEEVVDLFGRVFRYDPNPRTFGNFYVTGRVKSPDDLDAYTPEMDLDAWLPADLYEGLFARYPDRAFAFMHNGPLELTYEAMGIETFSTALYEDVEFVKELLERRTDFFVGLARRAVELGVDCVFLGDDSAFKGSSFMSPGLYDELMVPMYRKVVEASGVPVFWHSDGFVEELIPSIIKSGIRGVHALEPAAGVDLGRVKKNFGDDVVLVGNVCCSTVLTQTDLDVVRADVDRCMRQAKADGGYMLSSSNSMHGGTEVVAGVEMFRYGAEAGVY